MWSRPVFPYAFWYLSIISILIKYNFFRDVFCSCFGDDKNVAINVRQKYDHIDYMISQMMADILLLLLLLSFRSVAVFGVHFLLNTHYHRKYFVCCIFIGATKHGGIVAHQN